MKIHILPVDSKFQPSRQNFRMPTHGRDWNVERDFYSWLLNHPQLIAAKPEEADWDYLPFFWNLLYINWNWGEGHRGEIQAEILRLVSRNRPTFTICEYDIRDMQPFYDLCNMVVFTASRRDDSFENNIDIPLLCSRHKQPAVEKRYLASVAGNLQTDGIRMEMKEKLVGSDIAIIDGNKGPGFFEQLMASSYIALAPRGHGGQSFRFYEAMDMGVVPYHIGTPDTRPFKHWIDWDACSFYAPTVDDVYLQTGDILIEMGREAQRVYEEQLQYGQWCRYVLGELEWMRRGL